MTSLKSNQFLTNRAWFKAVLGNEDVILRHTSALEHLQLFLGYVNENKIDVYAKEQGLYENINYHLVDTFDGIDYVEIRGFRCTSINQTFNDMFDNFDEIDEQSLIEGLAKYYFLNGESFDGLIIKPENMDLFHSCKEWAMEYYSGG